MQLRFRSVDEPWPGEKSRRRFERLWPALRSWFLQEGESNRPGYATSRKALERYMPELLPLWDRLCELAGGGDLQARMLSLYRPTPYMSGCSQAVWTCDRHPILARNYDYHPLHCEGTILLSKWHGVRTIVQADCLWGALDGMNEHGLVVSLAFGGSQTVGDGFGIPLVLRYILEFCRNVDEARAVLQRVPSHMAYNVMVVDPSCRFINAHVYPGRQTLFANRAVATNHQSKVDWARHAAATHSVGREQFLLDQLDSPTLSRERFADQFLKAPLYNTRWAEGFGTLYTAVYDPIGKTVEYSWPNHAWKLDFDGFTESALSLRVEKTTVNAPTMEIDTARGSRT